LLDELGISNTLHWTETKMGFYYDGKLYKWGTPFALLGFDRLNLISKFRYALHVMYTKSIRNWRPLDNVVATQWLRKWLGQRAYDVLWKSLFELKFYEYTEDLSAAWIGTRIKRVALSRKSLMQETLGYLEGGSATLLKEMQRVIESRGGRIHLKSGIDRVAVNDGRVTGIVVSGKDIPCDAVLSTAPIQYVPRLVPDLPADFRARVEAIKNIPVACVILKLKHPLSENFWMNINDPGMEIPGVIEYSNLYKVGPTIVYAPFYMPKTHPRWALSNNELIDKVLSYLPKLNPAFRPEWVLAKHCHRYDFAQTICPPGFYEMLPPMATPVRGFFMADTSYYYPEDRSICESIKVGKELVHTALGAML
jgi:protoporphyrinogen oxidase